MSVSAILAITLWGLVVLGVLYGLLCDLRRWREARRVRVSVRELESAWLLPAAQDGPRRSVQP